MKKNVYLLLITLCVLGITSCEVDDLDSNETSIEIYGKSDQIDGHGELQDGDTKISISVKTVNQEGCEI